MDGTGSATTRERHAVAVWVVWLLCVCLWTYALLSPYPVQIKNALLPEPVGYPASKLLHVSAYAFLTGLAAWLLPSHKLRWLPILFLSFHAFGTEFLQQFVESRFGSFTDVGINHIGIALGLLLTWWKWLQTSSERTTPLSVANCPVDVGYRP